MRVLHFPLMLPALLIIAALISVTCAPAGSSPTDTPSSPQQPDPTATPAQQPDPTATPAQQLDPTATPAQQPDPTATPAQQLDPTATPAQQPNPTATPVQQADPDIVELSLVGSIGGDAVISVQSYENSLIILSGVGKIERDSGQPPFPGNRLQVINPNDASIITDYGLIGDVGTEARQDIYERLAVVGSQPYLLLLRTEPQFEQLEIAPVSLESAGNAVTGPFILQFFEDSTPNAEFDFSLLFDSFYATGSVEGVISNIVWRKPNGEGNYRMDVHSINPASANPPSPIAIGLNQPQQEFPVATYQQYMLLAHKSDSRIQVYDRNRGAQSSIDSLNVSESIRALAVLGEDLYIVNTDNDLFRVPVTDVLPAG